MTDDRPPDDGRDESPGDRPNGSSPDRSDESPPERPGDRPGDRLPSGVGAWISSLVRSLERLERRTGRHRSAVDFDVSIGSGLDSLAGHRASEGRDSTGDRDPLEPTRRRSEDPSADRRSSGRSTSGPRRDRESLGRRPGSPRGEPGSYRTQVPSREYHVTTRFHGEELQVTADVAGADEEDVVVGFAGSDLVLGVDGWELERVEVPWEDRSAYATVRNGILTVRVTRNDGDGGRDQ